VISRRRSTQHNIIVHADSHSNYDSPPLNAPRDRSDDIRQYTLPPKIVRAESAASRKRHSSISHRSRSSSASYERRTSPQTALVSAAYDIPFARPPTGPYSQPSVHQPASKFVIEPSDIIRDKTLGEGAFGIVYQARWRSVMVAVKELKGVSKQAKSQLVGEAERLESMKNHPNVVCFYGIVTKPLSIVLQFCEGGALDEALYGKSRVHFSTSSLHSIILDIAKGVAHLHAESFVHRDLAARNVLLDASREHALISDFGMSRGNIGNSIDQKTYSKIGPIKWMVRKSIFFFRVFNSITLFRHPNN